MDMEHSEFLCEKNYTSLPTNTVALVPPLVTDCKDPHYNLIWSE